MSELQRYSSFRLRTKFWGQNDKNLNKFGVTTDMKLSLISSKKSY